MQKKGWIDGMLLLTIGIVFQVIFPGLSYVKLDFVLAALILIVVMMQDQSLVIFSIAVVALFSALTSPVENVFVIILIEKLLTGGILVWIVKKTRTFFSDQVVYLCIIGVIGTTLHGLLSSLLIALGDGVTWGLFFDLLKEVTWLAVLCNVCAAYIFYVALEYGEKIFKTSCIDEN